MLIAMALLAFFWSAALPLVETVTFDHLRDEPARYSRIRLWGSIGFIVAVMGTGALLDSLPLPSLLWVIVGTLIGILIYALAVPEAPAQDRPDEHLPVATILRQTRVRALFAACFAMSAAHGALYVFYSIHLADHHYSKFLVGCLWSLGVLAEIVFSSSWRPAAPLRPARDSAAQFCRGGGALPDDRLGRRLAVGDRLAQLSCMG
jgi:PPP family 3-phenylpropionic acid transporter